MGNLEYYSYINSAFLLSAPTLYFKISLKIINIMTKRRARAVGG